MQTRATDAGATQAGESRVVVERPPPGLARGKYAWPAWGIGLLGAGVVLVALVYLALSARRRRKR